MYYVIIPKSVLRDIRRLDKSVTKIIEKVIEEIAENPYLGVPLKGGLTDFRKWEFREQGIHFRIAYIIYEERIEVRIFHIGPRENFYEQLKRRI